MIVTLRGGETFWRAVVLGAERALAGEYHVISPRDGIASEPVVEIRFLPVDVQDNYAILVIPDPDVQQAGNPWFEYIEREDALRD